MQYFLTSFVTIPLLLVQLIICDYSIVISAVEDLLLNNLQTADVLVFRKFQFLNIHNFGMYIRVVLYIYQVPL